MSSREDVLRMISIYQGFMLRERKRPRRPFRENGQPWRYMAEAAERCMWLGVKPQQYIGILVSHSKHNRRRTVPCPRYLASEDALQIVIRFLEHFENQKLAAVRSSDLANDVGASTNKRRQFQHGGDAGYGEQSP